MSEKLKKIKEIFLEILENDELAFDENFSMQTCPDWDSVVTVQVVMAVEAEFGVKFSTDEVANMKSVSDILRKIS